MNSILETLVTVVGAMLVLALISQSLIEILKTMFVLEGMTRKGATRQLLVEAMRSVEMEESDGVALYDAVCARVGRLGQDGWWNLRLDVLGADDLGRLVESIPTDDIPGLKSCPVPKALEKRTEVAAFVKEWHDLAMSPVSERYRRRMRVMNVATAAVVVLALNVDALHLFERARTDPDLRTAMATRATELDSLFTRVESLAAGAPTADSAGAGEPTTTADLQAARASLDSAVVQLASAAAEGGGLFESGRERRWRELDWWLGTVLAVLLVSLGAPFWHDVLGSVFGLKRSLEGGAGSASTREKTGDE